MSAQPNDFRYYLTYKSVRTEIIFAPEGWDTNTIVNYTRSTNYFGMIRSMALPLLFTLDGAQLLRRAYYNDGIEAGVIIEVEQLQKGLNLSQVWSYKTCFKGDIDFSQWDDQDDHVSVTLMDSGISRDVKAYEGIKYEYALTGSDVVNIILPGVAFNESVTFLISANGPGRKRDIMGLDLATESFKSGYVEAQTTFEAGVTDTGFSSSDNWFIKSHRVINVKISGKLEGIYFGNAGFSFRLMNENNETRAILFQNNTTSTAVSFDFTFDEDILLADGEQLYLYMRTNSNAGGQEIRVVTNEMVVSYNTVSDPSNCKGITAFNLYKRIMAKISPGAAVNSYLLNGAWKDLIFTSGDGIREIVNAKIKITFKEFFDSMNGIDDTGFGIENDIAVLENANYFARNIKILDLGTVKKCNIQPAQDYLFNSIKVGYNDGNTDDDNGRQEYNSGQEWQLPITRVKKEKNWVSPARADQYGIEKIRVDYNITSDKKTNDTSSDNDSFMLYCYLDGDNYRPVLGSSYDNVTGLTSPDSAYNLELSPKHNLLRHQGYLRGVMDRMDGRYINFASGVKNTELVTVKDGIVVKEKENIISSSLTGKYFIPNIATIITKMPRDTMWLIDNKPFGYIQLTYRGIILKGYLMDVPVDIAKHTEQTLKLLLTDDNNLLNLI